MRRRRRSGFRPARDGAIAIVLVVSGALIAAKVDTLGQARFQGSFRAVDGDTLASGATRYRLVGIDAPELDQTCEGKTGTWDCGQAARRFLADVVKGGGVECTGGDEDRYRRHLVRCTRDGEDVGGLMVAAGLALRTEYFLYAGEQERAQDRRLGLWSGDFEQPKDWRRAHKAAEIDAPGAGILRTLSNFFGW